MLKFRLPIISQFYGSHCYKILFECIYSLYPVQSVHLHSQNKGWTINKKARWNYFLVKNLRVSTFLNTSWCFWLCLPTDIYSGQPIIPKSTSFGRTLCLLETYSVSIMYGYRDQGYSCTGPTCCIYTKGFWLPSNGHVLVA